MNRFIIMAISTKDLLGQCETWVFLFLIGVALLNWPLLSLATRMVKIAGYPSILVYLATIWIMIIILAYLFDRRDKT
jgi:hypothetical protein